MHLGGLNNFFNAVKEKYSKRDTQYIFLFLAIKLHFMVWHWKWGWFVNTYWKDLSGSIFGTTPLTIIKFIIIVLQMRQFNVHLMSLIPLQLLLIIWNRWKSKRERKPWLMKFSAMRLFTLSSLNFSLIMCTVAHTHTLSAEKNYSRVLLGKISAIFFFFLLSCLRPCHAHTFVSKIFFYWLLKFSFFWMKEWMMEIVIE